MSVPGTPEPDHEYPYLLGSPDPFQERDNEASDEASEDSDEASEDSDEASEDSEEGETSTAAASRAISTGVANRTRSMALLVMKYITSIIANQRGIPQPLHFSRAGLEFMTSFDIGPVTMWIETFRMTKASFDALLNWLIVHTVLEGSRYITAREKLFIFLYIVCQGVTQTAAAYLFAHSDETIYR